MRPRCFPLGPFFTPPSLLPPVVLVPQVPTLAFHDASHLEPITTAASTHSDAHDMALQFVDRLNGVTNLAQLVSPARPSLPRLEHLEAGRIGFLTLGMQLETLLGGLTYLVLHGNCLQRLPASLPPANLM